MSNVRGRGTLVAWDHETMQQRDDVVNGERFRNKDLFTRTWIIPNVVWVTNKNGLTQIYDINFNRQGPKEPISEDRREMSFGPCQLNWWRDLKWVIFSCDEKRTSFGRVWHSRHPTAPFSGVRAAPRGGISRSTQRHHAPSVTSTLICSKLLSKIASLNLYKSQSQLVIKYVFIFRRVYI